MWLKHLRKSFSNKYAWLTVLRIRLAARIEAQSIETKGVRSGNELVSRRWDRMGDYKKIPLDHKVSRCRAECLCESSLKLVTDENLASNDWSHRSDGLCWPFITKTTTITTPRGKSKG